MGEEFNGLGSSFYIGLPGQPFEEMHEVKISKTVPSLVPSVEEPFEWKDEQKELRGFPKPGWQLTFDVVPGDRPIAKVLSCKMRRNHQSYEGFRRIVAEATSLMASWLAGGHCVSRYNRLRRHYNRWRRSYATRETLYAPPFNKFLHNFMVLYMEMRHSLHNPNTSKQ